MAWYDAVVQRILFLVFNMIAIGLIGLFVYLVWNGQDGYWASASLAIVALLATRLPDILNIRFGLTGVQAEMRGLVDEARASVEQVHLLALMLSKVTLQKVHGAGRWGGMTQREKRETRDQIIGGLRELDVPIELIQQVHEVEHPFLHFDYFHYVLDAAARNLTDEKKGAWNEFVSGNQRGIGGEPSPEELERFLREQELLEGEVIERLDDYRHYDRTFEHRRLEVWEAQD